MSRFDFQFYDERKKYYMDKFQMLLNEVNDESDEDTDAFFNAAEEILGDY